MQSGGAQSPQPASLPKQRTERTTIVLALMGTVASTLVFLLVLGYLGPFIQFVYNAWGFIGLLILIAGLLGFFAALMAFLLTGRRAEPRFEAGATIDNLETKQL